MDLPMISLLYFEVIKRQFLLQVQKDLKMDLKLHLALFLETLSDYCSKANYWFGVCFGVDYFHLL